MNDFVTLKTNVLDLQKQLNIKETHIKSFGDLRRYKTWKIAFAHYEKINNNLIKENQLSNSFIYNSKFDTHEFLNNILLNDLVLIIYSYVDKQYKLCGHICSQTNIHKCCACMDKRTNFINGYGMEKMYIDGKGDMMVNVRKNQFYCPLCSK